MGGVKIDDLPPEAIREQLARLNAPWIADEGPLDARFRRVDGINLHRVPADLLPRGLAFDSETTIEWDEDGVRVIREAEPDQSALEPGEFVLVRRSKARVRMSRFAEAGLAEVERVDYLRRGVLLASRYLPSGADHA